jgi:outer membrane protein assembly factor BamB
MDCQTAERCENGQCQQTWPHVEPTEMPEHYQATSIPMVADLDGDCVPEIVFNTFRRSDFTRNGVLRAIRGDTGAPVWTVEDAAFRTDSTANPAVADVDGDGAPEVFVASTGKTIYRIAADGTPVWESDAYRGPEGSGSVTVANLDGEGDAELVFGAAVFDSDGRLLFEGAAGAGFAGQGPISCVADLDGDARAEIVAGRTVYETSGTVAGGDFAGQARVSASTPDGYCGIADLDGDGGPEVVLVASGRIHVLQRQTLAPLASVAIPGGGQGGAPNIADFDGDGRPDIGTAGARNYVVARYAPAGPSLEILWRAPTEDDSSSRTGSSVFDFDGDGRAEVVYNDEEYLRIYPGTEPSCPSGPECDGVMTDAEVLFRDLNSSRTRTEYPVVADVDGDFKAEIVFSTSNEARFLDPRLVGDAGIEVWDDRLDNWVATRPVWHQHAYAITQVGPRGQIPPRPPPSWRPDYNAWRRNAQGGRDARCAPDLVVTDLRQDRSACPALAVEVTVANRGCLAVGSGAELALRDGAGPIDTLTASTAVGAGASVRLRSTTFPGRGFSAVLTAEVDPAGRFNECREDNNRGPELPVSCGGGL